MHGEPHFNVLIYLRLPFLQIMVIFYRPQRSCGKVMFSQASVILFTRGCVWQTPPGRHPPGRYPSGRHPTAQCMLGYTPPCPVHCEAFSVDAHVMPLGELYWYCWSPGLLQQLPWYARTHNMKTSFPNGFAHFINKQNKIKTQLQLKVLVMSGTGKFKCFP